MAIEMNIQFYVLVGLGVLAMFMAYKSFKVKGEKVMNINKGLVTIFLVAVGVGALWVSGVGTYISPSLTSPLAVQVIQAPSVGGGLPSGTICAVEDTTVTLSAINKYTSLATGGTHRYRINGGPAKELSDAGTFTASPGDQISILWFNASTSGSYFSDIGTVTVPCAGTKTFSKELVANGTASIQIYNEEGNVVDGATATQNETLANGDVVVLDMNIKAGFQVGFPHGGVLICEYNNSIIDDCIINLGGDEVNVPSIYDTVTLHDAKAYSVPAFENTEKLIGTMTIDVDDTNDPAGLPVSAMNVTFRPYNYYVNEDTGGSFDGPAVEDEDDSATYLYNPQQDILLS